MTMDEVGDSIGSLMRWLVDGYNMMHAGGLADPRLGREGFRRARRRFLDEISGAFGPENAREMTVVFDANVPPADFPLSTRYNGIAIVFALGDENADARIEQLIAQHPNPKALTVVSSDNRIRLAAVRRRAKAMKAEEFWVRIDSLKEEKVVKPRGEHQPAAPASDEAQEPAPGEAAYWLETFGNLPEIKELEESLGSKHQLLTDAEIAEIEREIERET
jgi:predicted RNA-binding protein with PIN domain